jgi:uncharacterized membrane protein YphA (DoxX/SURF4 family)
MSKYEKMQEFAPIVLRVGIALVFLWFGIDQLKDAESWVGMIPQSVTDISGMTATTLVQLNGTFEVIFGLALIVGFFGRISGLLLGLHLLSIIGVVGYNAIGVRDFGLMMACFAIALFGSGRWSVDEWLVKRKQ